MTKDCIYIKIYNNLGIKTNNLKVKLIDKYNKIAFKGITDNFGRVKIPICDNDIYRLIIYSNLSILKIPLIAKKNKVYCINIINNIANNRKYLVTFMLIDKYNPNIKIEGGNMILWQGTQFQ